MTRPRSRFRPADPLSIAEAVFKAAPSQPAESRPNQAPPFAEEIVSIKFDNDLVAHFQEDGSGWQERMNNAC